MSKLPLNLCKPSITMRLSCFPSSSFKKSSRCTMSLCGFYRDIERPLERPGPKRCSWIPEGREEEGQAAEPRYLQSSEVEVDQPHDFNSLSSRMFRRNQSCHYSGRRGRRVLCPGRRSVNHDCKLTKRLKANVYSKPHIHFQLLHVNIKNPSYYKHQHPKLP